MRRQFQAAIFFPLSLVMFGCTDNAVAPATNVRANVVILADSIVGTTVPYGAGPRDVTGIQFKLDATVTNTGTTPFQYDFCASTIEQQVEGEWRAAWAPACALEGGNARGELSPGESFTQTIDGVATLSASRSLTWNDTMPPTGIRLSAGLIPTGVGGTISREVSNSIELVVRR